MSEYEALKAQKDELEKLSKEKYMNQGAAEERARIRAIINDALRQTEKAIKTSKDPYFYGCRDTMNALLKDLKDGEADAGR
jgi:ElaB/YqjD/DUF883 family membrane-anchored ribosome-binding protein